MSIRKDISTIRRVMGELEDMRLPTEELNDTAEIISKLKAKAKRLEDQAKGNEKVRF